MRLLNTTTHTLRYFPSTPPPYAILSHRWRDEEVTFQDLSLPNVSTLKGHAKLTSACAFARGLGCDYLWIDTCCIDKTSSAELSESLNSMFKWYKEAALCLAYLDDVEYDEWESGLSGSEWWKRGWTLQELVAPGEVLFLAKGWEMIGTKTGMAERVAEISGVDKNVLLTGEMDSVTVAERMAWAAERETLKVEDGAYCLMGIFGINMPTLYGEGPNAFTRLQEEILKKSDDQTIFAWGLFFDHSESETLPSPQEFEVDSPHMNIGLLASSPASFLDYTPLRRLSFSAVAENLSCASPEGEIAITNSGTRVRIPKLTLDEKRGIYLAFLPCEDKNGNILAIYLQNLHGSHFARVGSYGPPDLLSIPYRLIDSGKTESKYIYVTRDKPKPFSVSILALVNGGSITDFCKASGFEVKGKGSVDELNTWDDSAHALQDCDFDVQDPEPTYLLLRHDAKGIGIFIAFTIEPSRLARADRNLFSVKAVILSDAPEGIAYPSETSSESIKHLCERWQSHAKVDEAPMTNFASVEIPGKGNLTLLMMCDREPNWGNVDGYNDCKYTVTAQWGKLNDDQTPIAENGASDKIDRNGKRDHSGKAKDAVTEEKGTGTRGMCRCVVI